MTDESLEDKINNADKKVSLWDSLIMAYSSGKAITTAFLTTALGYSISLAIAAGALVYTGIKTINSVAKYVTRLIIDPYKYLHPREVFDYSYESILNLNPFGRYRRASFIGTAISTANLFLPF